MLSSIFTGNPSSNAKIESAEHGMFAPGFHLYSDDFTGAGQ